MKNRRRPDAAAHIGRVAAPLLRYSTVENRLQEEVKKSEKGSPAEVSLPRG
jgi:hypothetical protein